MDQWQLEEFVKVVKRCKVKVVTHGLTAETLRHATSSRRQAWSKRSPIV